MKNYASSRKRIIIWFLRRFPLLATPYPNFFQVQFIIINSINTLYVDEILIIPLKLAHDTAKFP